MLAFADQRHTDVTALKGARARKSMGPAAPSFFKKGATQIDKSKYQEENGWKPFACEGACESNYKSAHSNYTHCPGP